LTGYYRKFIHNYSQIVTPLNQLLKKNRPFEWDEQCQASFDDLKGKMQRPPVLTLPNDTDTFVLDTDASGDCIGAVLSQIQDGQERVVAFAGRALTTNEKNYCVTRKELLAVVYFLKYFRQYLLGRSFIIRTDHAALTWLKKTPEPIGQNARWVELLEEYTFQIQHRPGDKHCNVDSISRHPCLNRPSCTACHATYRAYAVRGTDQTSEGDKRNSDNGPQTDDVLQTNEQSNTQLAQLAADSEQSINSDTGQPLPSREDGSADYIGWSKDELIQAQHQDPDVNFVNCLKEQFQTRPEWKEVEGHSSAVKSLWHEFDRLQVQHGVLCRKWVPIHGSKIVWQIVLPRSYRRDFIRSVHSGITGGHLGRSKTEEQVRRRAYWPSWREDVATEVRKCEECCRYHRGSAPKQTPLHPFFVGEPFEMISIDITGKHPRSYRGNEFIVTIVDIFTKWAEAIPVRTHIAPVVAKVLLDHIISRFGTPSKILSDQGREFESNLFQELCSKLEIHKVRSSPYTPSTNGCVERFHRTLNSMLAKVITDNQRDWDDRLSAVMAAYRSARHESTGFSPNFLVFGHENRAPIDLILGPILEESEEVQNRTYDEFVEQQLSIYQEAYQVAREHLGNAAQRRKTDYDQHVRSVEFQVGEWVWYYYPRRYVQRSPKWTKNYDGPFLIIRKILPCDYVIQKTRRSVPQVVHANKLKRYIGPTLSSWLPEDRVQSKSVGYDQGEPCEQMVERTPSGRQRNSCIPKSVTESGNDDPELPAGKRSRRVPRWFEDYVC